LTLPYILFVTGFISFNLLFALLSCAAIRQCREKIEEKKKSISSCEALGCCGQISTTVKETPLSIY